MHQSTKFMYYCFWIIILATVGVFGIGLLTADWNIIEHYYNMRGM